MKIDKRNNQNFANSVFIERTTLFKKEVFTYCQFRENNKCPPWELEQKN